MYTNCDTLTNKLSELTVAIELNNPDIIVLTEVTPKNNRYTLQKSEIEIKGFNLFTTNFNEKDSRGVAIYVKKSIISNQIEIENMANDTVWVEVTIEKNKKMLIGGIYRSPNNSALRNKLLFDTIVTASNINKDNLLLMGDFNCSEINWDDLTTQDQNMESLTHERPTQHICCKKYTCTLPYTYLIKFYNMFVSVFYTYNLTYIQKKNYYSTLYHCPA